MSKTWLGNMFDAVASVFEHEVWPWFSALWHNVQLDAVAAIKDLAVEAADEVANELPLLIHEPGEFLKAFNATVAKTLQKAEAAAIQIADTDIIAASHAAITHKAKELANPPQ